MLIVRRPDWFVSETRVTPREAVLNRRALLGAAAALPFAARLAQAADAPGPAPAGTGPRNPAFDGGRPLTEQKWAETYNNYYEFGEDKAIWRDAQALKQRPWTVRLDGLVKEPRTIAIDDLLRQMPLEERVYRHRCVEAWAMTVPWSGFPLAALLRAAEPLGSAKYVVFETVQDRAMTNLRNPLYPWPYVEALTMDEAANDLAFISTGLFGHALPPQNGGPIRLTVPWKYGFKSAKSIGTIRFTEDRPKTMWESLNPYEYGFWANVNPAVAHPRWSQASERLIGTNDRVPTQIYNGYGPMVASLYTSRQNEKLYM